MIFSAIVRVNLASLAAQVVQVGGFPILLAFALDAQNRNEAVIGVITTLPWLAVLFGAGLLPRVIRKTDERHTALIGVMLSLLGLGLLLWSVALPVLVLSALLMGAGLVLRWVACDTWIVRLARPEMRGRAIGLHETLMGLGIAIGPAILLVREMQGWDPTLVFVGLMVLSLVLFVFSPLGPGRNDEIGNDVTGPGRTLYLLLLASLFAALLSGLAETSSVALLPLWFVEKGLTEPMALSLLISFGLGGTVLQLPIGSIADRCGQQTAERLCALILVLGCLANLLLLDTPVVVLYLSLFIWGGAIGGLNTLAVIDAGARTTGEDTSRAMAAIASAYTAGGVIGPALLGGVWGVISANAMMICLAVIGAGYLGMQFRRQAR